MSRESVLGRMMLCSSYLYDDNGIYQGVPEVVPEVDLTSIYDTSPLSNPYSSIVL